MNQLNLQVEALEKEVTDIQDNLFRIKGIEGADIEYRELKEKWYEKQQQLRELKNAESSFASIVNGFIPQEKESNTETAVLLSTEYYETKNDPQEHAGSETLTMYNAPASELRNTISEKEKETKKLYDRIDELENLPKVLSEKNRLLLQELETLKAEHNQLKEQYANLQATQHKIAEQATTNTTLAHTNDTLHTSTDTNLEIKNLQNKISELESLSPVLTEKNLLIEFLQNQLDKQVKNNFQLEKENSQLKAQMLQVNEIYQQGQTMAAQLQEELQKKEQYNILITTQYEKAVQVNEMYKQQLGETIEKLSSLQTHLRGTVESSVNSENH